MIKRKLQLRGEIRPAMPVNPEQQGEGALRLKMKPVSRRRFMEMAATAVASGSITGVGNAKPRPRNVVTLFDGQTLGGGIQIENSATSLSASRITDQVSCHELK